LSNRDFVEQLYETAMGREGEAAGVDAWSRVLDAGVDSRVGVALGFSNSAEMSRQVAYHVNNHDLSL
jgi:Domain of unknown function (DUF4214)